MSSWPSCWLTVKEEEGTFRKLSQHICFWELRRHKPGRRHIRRKKEPQCVFGWRNTWPFFLNQTHEGNVCILGRFVWHFPLLSRVFQSVKENNKLLCRGPSLNITEMEEKLLEDLLPPKAEDSMGMVCLGKWCFYSKSNQVGLAVAAFQWWESHWNHVLHRHSQVYSQARWACTNSLPLQNSLWVFRLSSSQWCFPPAPERPQEGHISVSLSSES